MQHLLSNSSALDYFPCRYGTSKQLFRGPRRRLEGAYAAFLGGTETYGKFMDTPFPSLLEWETGLKSVNLGCANAGIDLYLNDQSLLDICGNAQVTVVQVIGAGNLSNRFYSVHPRRNDRFVSAAAPLRTLYPEVDFTEVAFTRHLLSRLASVSEVRFRKVVDELQTAWSNRMRVLLSKLAGPKVLLWLSSAPPPQTASMAPDTPEPILVDRHMLDDLFAGAGESTSLVEIVATAEERARGLDGMHFTDTERHAAQEMLGPLVHRRVAEILKPALTPAP